MLLNDRSSFEEQIKKVTQYKNFTGIHMLSEGQAMFFTGQGKPSSLSIVKAKETHAQLGKKARAIERLRNKLQVKNALALEAGSSTPAITEGK
jgi:hypothetical protein